MPVSTPINFSKSVDYASLKDRNVLITGGASGFGKAFVQMFAKNGANVVFGDLQDGAAKELEALGKSVSRRQRSVYKLTQWQC